MLITEFLLAGLGLVILLLAGDTLVRGAVNLSLRLGIPALVVSLTIVAFGTSAPELLISISAILEGVPGLAKTLLVSTLARSLDLRVTVRRSSGEHIHISAHSAVSPPLGPPGPRPPRPSASATMVSTVAPCTMWPSAS